MLNSKWFYNSRPDGHPVLQIEGKDPKQLLFVPLRGTELLGRIDGPLALLELVQTFAFSRSQLDMVVEALYRFPLPGDAAVLSVKVKFGEVEIETELKPRKAAEKEYQEAKERGDQAALMSRESPDVFSLRVAGIAPDEEVRIATRYLHLGSGEGDGFAFRLPLTTAPRYVRSDERFSPYARGQPLALLRDPGHRFKLGIECSSGRITSPTHLLSSAGGSIALEGGEVLTDRDCVLIWRPDEAEGAAAQVYMDEDEEGRHFLALVSPPGKGKKNGGSKEIIILVDHSGSMEGAKWAATDWAVEKLLEGLGQEDHFNLCLFHNQTLWLEPGPIPATKTNIARAIKFLGDKSSGGTELGVALEQAMRQEPTPGGQDRQVLLLTDAQVSDQGRILQVVEGGAKAPAPQRTSIICIDSAPNSYLAKEMARKGRGLCRFLSSSPDEADITSALEGVLAEMRSPLLGASWLEFDQKLANVFDARFENVRAGGRINLSDLRQGSSHFFIGRLAKGTDVPEVRLKGAGSGVRSSASPGVRSLYGSCLVTELERLMLSAHSDRHVLDRLQELGLKGAGGAGAASVYYENDQRKRREMVEKALVDVSLEYGVASSVISFIAVRRGAGRRVEGTSVVANALPQGWSEDFLTGAPPMAVNYSVAAQMRTGRKMAAKSVAAMGMGRAADAEAMVRGHGKVIEVFSGLPKFDGGQAVLFDTRRAEDMGKLHENALLTFLNASCDVAVKEDVELLVYVGDFTLPAIRMGLAELLRKKGRPINLRVRKGDEVVIALVDASGGAAFGGKVTVTVSA